MKRLIRLSSGVCRVAMVGGLATVLAGTVVAPAQAQSAALRVAYVNYSLLIQESPQAQSAVAQLREEFEPKQRNLQAEANELKARESSTSGGSLRTCTYSLPWTGRTGGGVTPGTRTLRAHPGSGASVAHADSAGRQQDVLGGQLLPGVVERACQRLDRIPSGGNHAVERLRELVAVVVG